MNSLPQTEAASPPALMERSTQARRADLTYQAMTVAAILLLLGSLWVF